jgi:hypothetical protein
VKQLHVDLIALGFTGSYGRVAAFARSWREDRQRDQQTTGRGTFVPLHFDPGDAFQFDWSEDFAVLGGERTKLQMAHICIDPVKICSCYKGEGSDECDDGRQHQTVDGEA